MSHPSSLSHALPFAPTHPFPKTHLVPDNDFPPGRRGVSPLFPLPHECEKVEQVSPTVWENHFTLHGWLKSLICQNFPGKAKKKKSKTKPNKKTLSPTKAISKVQPTGKKYCKEGPFCPMFIYWIYLRTAEVVCLGKETRQEASQRIVWNPERLPNTEMV